MIRRILSVLRMQLVPCSTNKIQRWETLEVNRFIELHDDGLEYLGPMDLTQYFIRTTNMIKDKDGSINVIVVLGRRLLGIKYNVQILHLIIIFLI